MTEKVILTEKQLNDLWNSWHKDAESFKHLRFGQYVYNQTKFETDASYNIRDPHLAYANLQAAVDFLEVNQG